jgi:hypothetical protein
LHGDLEGAGHLLGLRYKLTIVAALREEVFRVRFLKILLPISPLGMCAAIARTGTRLRWQS